MRTGDAQRREVDDLVLVAAAGSGLPELVDRPARGEQHAARTEDDAAVVVFADRRAVARRAAAEAGDVLRSIANDRHRVKAARSAIRRTADQQRVAVEESEAAVVTRQTLDRAEVGDRVVGAEVGAQRLRMQRQRGAGGDRRGDGESRLHAMLSSMDPEFQMVLLLARYGDRGRAKAPQMRGSPPSGGVGGKTRAGPARAALARGRR
jgi:hypothetical protein